MKVKELASTLSLEILAGTAGIEKNISGGFCSDLLSYVMGKAQEGYIWITIQGHKNIMAVASLKELSAIIIADDIMPEQGTLDLANEEEIPVLKSQLSSFELAVELGKILKM